MKIRYEWHVIKEHDLAISLKHRVQCTDDIASKNMTL